MGKKTTELVAITEIASNDILFGVDVSDTSGSVNGTNKKFTKASLLSGLALESPQLSGWNPLGYTLEYVSVDNPTGVVRVAGVDVTSLLSVGMRIKFTNGGNVIYGIITAIAFSTNTTITFLHEINPANNQALTLVGNSTITLPYFSTQKAPHGFPLDPNKWSLVVKDSGFRSGSTTQNAWQNISQLNITIPIGLWRIAQKFTFYASRATNGIADSYYTLSTANNSETNTDSTCRCYVRATTDGARTEAGPTIQNSFILNIASKTAYYTNVKTTQTGITAHGLDGASAPLVLTVTCAYL